MPRMVLLGTTAGPDCGCSKACVDIPINKACVAAVVTVTAVVPVESMVLLLPPSSSSWSSSLSIATFSCESTPPHFFFQSPFPVQLLRCIPRPCAALKCFPHFSHWSGPFFFSCFENDFMDGFIGDSSSSLLCVKSEKSEKSEESESSEEEDEEESSSK